MNKDDIMIVEFHGQAPYGFVEKVVVFNKQIISEETVHNYILAGEIDYCDSVLVMEKEYYHKVFG